MSACLSVFPIQWVSVSAHHSLGKCACPSVCPPLTTFCYLCQPVYDGSTCPCLSVYPSVGQCVHLFDCLLLTGSVCPPVCMPSIQWVSVSARQPLGTMGRCVWPSVCPPFSESVRTPFDCLPFSRSVCPPLWLSTIQWISVSTFMSVYHSMGQSGPFLTVYHSMGKCPVHLLNCLPFSGSVCPTFWLSTIQWANVSPFWLSTIQWVNVLSTFWTVYHLVGLCVHLFVCQPFSRSVCPPLWLSTKLQRFLNLRYWSTGGDT